MSEMYKKYFYFFPTPSLRFMGHIISVYGHNMPIVNFDLIITEKNKSYHRDQRRILVRES